ncbi:hypothetical protein BDW59DRAFT_150972, partial [Aspergillus cavernicola]
MLLGYNRCRNLVSHSHNLSHQHFHLAQHWRVSSATPFHFSLPHPRKHLLNLRWNSLVVLAI